MLVRFIMALPVLVFLACPLPRAYAGPAGIPAGFMARCAHCHDDEVAPVLLRRGLPADYIEYVVRLGPGAMPAFRETEISHEEMADIIAFIRSTDKDGAGK